MECVECSDFAESFVADQSLFAFGSSFLVSAEIEGQSLAKQLDVRRTTLVQQLSFSLDLGIQKLMDTVNIMQTFLLILINVRINVRMEQLICVFSTCNTHTNHEMQHFF